MEQMNDKFNQMMQVIDVVNDKKSGTDHESQIRGRSNSIGYAANMFSGKSAQMQQVCEKLKEKGFIPPQLIENEVIWFYKYANSNIKQSWH